MAMVSQDTYIFMGTVADNIAYANPEATRRCSAGCNFSKCA